MEIIGCLAGAVVKYLHCDYYISNALSTFTADGATFPFTLLNNSKCES